MSLYESLKRDKKMALNQKGKSFSNAIDYSSLAQKSSQRYRSDPFCSNIERFRDKDDMNPREKLKKVKPTSGKSLKSPPNKIGEIKLNTGLVEIGYDPKKDEIVLTFTEKHTRTKNSRQLIEGDTVKRSITNGSERFMTNDKSFLGGANVLRSDASHDLVYIEQQMDKFSDDEQNLTTMDDVLDFRQTSKSKKESSLPTQDKNFKEEKSFLFRQKFFKAVNQAKQTAREMKSKARDDIIFLYMLKKRLAEEDIENVKGLEDIEKELKEQEKQEQENQDKEEKINEPEQTTNESEDEGSSDNQDE